MVTEDYVSFETAKLLKEKGFDEYGIYFYTLKDEGREGYKSNRKLGEFAHNSAPDLKERAVSCPTLAMAMKWLREEHGLFIGLVYQRECLSKTDKWFWKWNISNKHNKFAFVEFGESDSYEEACEAAIKYCLEKLI